MPNGCWACDECIETTPRAPPAPRALHYVIIPNAAAAPPGICQRRTLLLCFFYLKYIPTFIKLRLTTNQLCRIRILRSSIITRNSNKMFVVLSRVWGQVCEQFRIVGQNACRGDDGKACSAVSTSTRLGAAGRNSECTPFQPSRRSNIGI